MRTLCLLVTLFSLCAQDYYVSPDGNDSNSGSSSASPWRSIGKLNARSFAAGDRILLQGGRSFTDAGLRFASDDRGTPTQPIVVATYGGGRATLRPASDQHGIDIYNTAGIQIRDLIVIGRGISSSSKSGLQAYCDLPGGARLPHLQVHNCAFSEFYHGIVIGAWEPSFSGFDDVLIADSLVHTIRKDGITSWGYWESKMVDPPMSHRRVTIRDCEVRGVTGDPNKTSGHSGSGIILSNVREGLIDRCYAHHNGGSAGNSGGGGPVGIWTWHSDRVVIQRCLVHDQKTTPGVKDGGGFDLDGGASNGVIQYCYSYNNEGPGYLIAAFGGCAPLTNGTIRYNLSWRDARRVGNGHGSGIHFWNGSNPASHCSKMRIYNNTIYAEAATGESLIRYQSGQMSDHLIANNILVVQGGERFVQIDNQLPAFTFRNNAYFALDGNYNGGWRWGGSTYTSLAAWRGTSGSPETHNGQPLGFQLDPRVASILSGAQPTSIAQMEAMTAFQLRDDSPVIDAGIDLRSSSYGSLEVGTRDFSGTPIPAGAGFDLGAHDRKKVSSTTAPAAPSGLSASASSNTTITLRWTDRSSDETGFRIERATGSGSFGLLSTVGAGITIHHDSGLPAGTSYRYRVRAHNAAGSSAWSNEATASTPHSSPTPYGGSPQPIPGTIQAEHFDEGGLGITWHDSSTGNTGGAFRATDVDISGDGQGGHHLGWITDGEWLDFTVAVAAAGSYQLEAKVASKASSPGSLRVRFGGSDATGVMAAPATGGWQTWTTITSPTFPLAAGQQRMRIEMIGGSFNLDWVRLVQIEQPNSPPSGELIANGDFEVDVGGSQSPSGWMTWAQSTSFHDADYTETYGGSASGEHHLTHYRGETGSWHVYSYQIIDGLPAGRYTLRAQARRSGNGFTACRMEAKDYGGTKRTVAIPASGSYQPIEISGIEVSGGSCTVGFWSVVENGSAWPYAYIDLVSFTAESATTPSQPAGALPAGWSAGDIGAVAASGSATEHDGEWTVTGSGSDIWNQRDEFHFVHQTLTGDGVLSVRVDALAGSHAWAKAGLMIRETLAADSRHAFTCLTPGNGAAFQRRSSTAGSSAHTAGPQVAAPYWLRLERSGDTFIGSCSSDGLHWLEIRRITMSLPQQAQVGLAVTSHADGALCSARFSEFSVLPLGSN